MVENALHTNSKTITVQRLISYASMFFLSQKGYQNTQPKNPMNDFNVSHKLSVFPFILHSRTAMRIYFVQQWFLLYHTLCMCYSSSWLIHLVLSPRIIHNTHLQCYYVRYYRIVSEAQTSLNTIF